MPAGTVEVSHGAAPGEETAIPWTEVDSFWESEATDRHFLCELNGEDDSVWLTFGDGVEGSLPPSDDTIYVRFVRTDEATGNCGSGVIYSVPDGFTELITVTNIEPATGGGPSECIDSIRRMIPAVTAIQRRGVTGPDYEALVGHLAGVLYVQAFDRNDGPAWFPYQYQGLYVVPNGGGPMSSLLTEQILALLCRKGHLGSWPNRYILLDATEAPLSVAARIGVLPGYAAETVRNAVIAAIQGALAVENQSLGGTQAFLDLHRAAAAVAGCSWVEFDSPTGDVTSGLGELITAGTVSVTVV